MSYNPAFVLDESPLGCGQDNAGDQSNGIKLTSFKPLKASADVASGGGAQQASPKRPKQHNSSSNNKAKKNKNNLLLSTSSSLSLIENQSSALSSLSPTSSSSFSSSSQRAPTVETTTTTSSSLTSTSLATQISGSAAVECRDMRYDVGRGHNHKTILHDINVTVPEGSIYGLLGPSGCGKTTMLRCVVGRIKPKSGQVRVFGYRPNESGSQIPGPAIGYMPQVSVFWFRLSVSMSSVKRTRKRKTDTNLAFTPPKSTGNLSVRRLHHQRNINLFWKDQQDETRPDRCKNRIPIELFGPARKESAHCEPKVSACWLSALLKWLEFKFTVNNCCLHSIVCVRACAYLFW